MHVVSVVHADPFPDPPEPQTQTEGQKRNKGGISEEHTVTKAFHHACPAAHVAAGFPRLRTPPPSLITVSLHAFLVALSHQTETRSLAQSDTCEVLVRLEKRTE